MEEAFEDQGPQRAFDPMMMIMMTMMMMIITTSMTLMAAGILLEGLRKSDSKRHC
jgi:hypothetical protein